MSVDLDLAEGQRASAGALARGPEEPAAAFEALGSEGCPGRGGTSERMRSELARQALGLGGGR